MNLVYLWIEDKNNKNNIGFNFGGKYRFLFKQEKNENTDVVINTLEIYENSNYIENFYKTDDLKETCIDSLTCIVGENGAGKTTLLNTIAKVNLSFK